MSRFRNVFISGVFLTLFNANYIYSKEDTSSVFLLDQKWTNKEGKNVELKSLKGKPSVTTMIFTSCLGACPTMINNMKKFDEVLTKDEKSKIKYYAFSMDTKRDTPEVLKSFSEKMSLDDRWDLFTSNEDQVRELSIALGFSYMKLDTGDFTHSSSLFLVSSDGVILAKHDQGNTWDEFLLKFREEIKKAPTKTKSK